MTITLATKSFQPNLQGKRLRHISIECGSQRYEAIRFSVFGLNEYQTFCDGVEVIKNP